MTPIKTLADQHRNALQLVAFAVASALIIYALYLLCTVPFELPRAGHAWREVPRLHREIERFVSEEGRCPTASELVDGRFTVHYLDGWGEPYRVTCVPDGEWGSVKVWSTGRDRRNGTDDDIRSWQSWEQQQFDRVPSGQAPKGER